MNRRLPAIFGALFVVLGAAAGTAWWRHEASEPAPAEIAADDLPVPPFPPRIAGDDDEYDKCLATLVDDPEAAEAMAATWQATGGGDAATHCQGLAMIANGEPDAGADLLEHLAHGGKIQGLAQVVLLSQASQARLMADDTATALKDATEALDLAPDDPELLIDRAAVNDAIGHSGEEMDDLNRALSLDDSRGDALVLRSAVWRRMDKLDEARADIEKAIALDPDDAEALLERGIIRQRMGDASGARADWTRAQEVDPSSEAAELAAQNLTLLEAGPALK
jgi:tetratricopeptide (TPR) repeat protein